jgi:hypothetical protein
MNAVKALGLVVLSFVISAFVSIFFGCIFFSVAPCEWFGSSFEGSCGYGAFFVTLAAVIVATIILTFITFRFFLKKKQS